MVDDLLPFHRGGQGVRSRGPRLSSDGPSRAPCLGFGGSGREVIDHVTSFRRDESIDQMGSDEAGATVTRIRAPSHFFRTHGRGLA